MCRKVDFESLAMSIMLYVPNFSQKMQKKLFSTIFFNVLFPILYKTRDKRYITIVNKFLDANYQTGQKLVVSGCFENHETFMITKNSIQEISALKCNHEEADTRVFAHAAWSRKSILEFVASDTDIFAILLLNHMTFKEKQLIISSSKDSGKLDMTKLMNAMDQDPNTDLTRCRNKGVPTPTIFGIIHPLIGSDILCSPRGFGPTWIMKTCIDYATYLFHETHGLQSLQLPDWHSRSKGAYVRFVLALFKKKFASKIKEKPEDLLECQEDFKELISNLQKQTWAYTLE